MRLCRPREDIDKFFALMDRQFTPDEWTKIRKPSEEQQQLQQFYQYWSLKESYVKAVGVGLGLDLRRLSFV